MVYVSPAVPTKPVQASGATLGLVELSTPLLAPKEISVPLELYTSTYESNVLFQTVASSALRIVSTRTDTKSLLPIAPGIVKRNVSSPLEVAMLPSTLPRPFSFAPGMLVSVMTVPTLGLNGTGKFG